MTSLRLLIGSILIAAPLPARDFVADLNGVRNVVATQSGGQPAVLVSSLPGDVACYTLDGNQVWKVTV